MTDQEFYELYGRMPRRTQPGKKKIKVYWGRVIIALIILILIIVGIVKLIGFAIGKITGNKEEKEANTAVSAVETNVSSQAVQDTVSQADDSIEVTPIAANDNYAELTVCIDAAHGGYDDGAASLDMTRIEKYDTLNIASKLRDEFEARGVTVYLTRVDDSFVELEDRCSGAMNKKCDLMISVHRGYTDDGVYNGVEAYVHSDKPASDTGFAQSILEKLTAAGASPNRGVMYGYVTDPTSNYYTNEYTSMPSVLLNLGYISNDNDNAQLDNNIDAYCKAIVDAVINEARAQGVIDESGKRADSTPLKSQKNYSAIVTEPENSYNYVVGAQNDQDENTEQNGFQTNDIQPEENYAYEEPVYTEDGLGQYTDPMMTN